MIFDKRYDKTLYLILSVDDKNRDKIIDFITRIPKELYEQIRIGLEMQDKYNKGEIKKFPSGYLSNFILVGDREYSYAICGDTLELYDCIRVDQYSYKPIFQMSLESFDNYKKTNCFEKNSLGEISYNFRYVRSKFRFDSNGVKYDLNKTILGPVLTFVVNENKLIVKGLNGIKMGNIPEDIGLDEIKEDDNSNKVLSKNISGRYYCYK